MQNRLKRALVNPFTWQNCLFTDEFGLKNTQIRRLRRQKTSYAKLSYDNVNHLSPPIPLNNESLLEGVYYLCRMDPDLSEIVSDIGYPPLWYREPGFPTIVHIILEQQVSLASAKAAFMKLQKAAGELTPERFRGFTDVQLREFGFSRQKTRYVREISQAILNGDIDLDKLPDLDDHIVRNELMKIKGIGPWTADIYLLMVLLRPDIWPSGDLALAKAVQDIKHLSERPDIEQLSEIGEGWKPYRAVAARILWHYYLC